MLEFKSVGKSIGGINIFENLNQSTDKAEKDIGIYKSSISKLEQAKELIQELRVKDKKKNQKG